MKKLFPLVMFILLLMWPDIVESKNIKPVYNVILAIDNSGSMDDSLWAQRTGKKLSDPQGIRFIAGELAINILNQLQSGDTLTLFNVATYSFAKNTVLLHPMVNLKNYLVTKRVIDSIYSEKAIIRRKVESGFTNFDKLFKEITSGSLKCNSTNTDTLLCHNVLIVITDGNIDGMSDEEIKEYFGYIPKSKLEKRRKKEEILKNYAKEFRKRDIKLYMILVGKEASKDTTVWNYLARDITSGGVYHLHDIKKLINYIFMVYTNELPVAQFNVPKVLRTRLFTQSGLVIDTFNLDSVNYPYIDQLKFMIFISSIAPIDRISISSPSGETYTNLNNSADVNFLSFRHTHAITIKTPAYGKWGIEIEGKKLNKKSKVFVDVNLLVKYPYLYITEPDLSLAYPSKTKMVFKGVFLSSKGIFRLTKERLKHLSTELSVFSTEHRRVIYAGEFRYDKRENKFVTDSIIFPQKGKYLLKLATYYYPDPKNKSRKIRLGNERFEVIFISPIPKIKKLDGMDTLTVSPHKALQKEFYIINYKLAKNVIVKSFLLDNGGKIVKPLPVEFVSDTEFIVHIERSSSIPGFGLRGMKKIMIRFEGELNDEKVNVPFKCAIVPYFIDFKWNVFDYLALLIYILIIVIPVVEITKKEIWKRSLITPRGIFKIIDGPTKEIVGEEEPLDLYGKKIVTVGINTGDVMLEGDVGTICKCFNVFSRKEGNEVRTFIKPLTSEFNIIVDNVPQKKGKITELYDGSKIEIGGQYVLEYSKEEIVSW